MAIVLEEMTIVLCCVTKKGILMERFVGVIHINDKSAQSSKETIDSLLMSYSMSPSKIRAQGYNGDANMEKEINDLKTQILQDNMSAYCTHCFAQPLHLTLVSVAKRQRDVDDFFGMLTFMLNLIGVSFERQDFSQENQVENLEELLKFGKILTGRDFNQKYDELERSSDAPLESHLKLMWADGLVDDLQSFEFVYMQHVMFKVLSITKELDIVLQRKDQDIVNVLKLVGTTKRQFEIMRDGEWEHFMDDVSSFCVKYDILIPKMDYLYVIPRGLKRKVSTVTYSHHYRVEVFDVVIDSQ
ncbi:uncharacterized protein LOC129900037 [Solanum dulcamara]|uniref:uncharacterized protein LOC129900037 n=1 Tax=Solanum dulcamara TaxID=45834 RepID=UPI0024853D40|nr:uncharacterized protein LOC129900037 [Solanum dulcamara]